SPLACSPSRWINQNALPTPTPIAPALSSASRVALSLSPPYAQPRPAMGEMASSVTARPTLFCWCSNRSSAPGSGSARAVVATSRQASIGAKIRTRDNLTLRSEVRADVADGDAGAEQQRPVTGRGGRAAERRVLVLVTKLVGAPQVQVHGSLAGLATVADGDADAHAGDHRQRRGKVGGGQRRREPDPHGAQLEADQPLVPLAIEPGQARQGAEVEHQHAAGRRDVKEAGGNGGRRVETKAPLADHQRPLRGGQRGAGLRRADVAHVVGDV